MKLVMCTNKEKYSWTPRARFSMFKRPWRFSVTVFPRGPPYTFLGSWRAWRHLIRYKGPDHRPRAHRPRRDRPRSYVASLPNITLYLDWVIEIPSWGSRFLLHRCETGPPTSKVSAEVIKQEHIIYSRFTTVYSHEPFKYTVEPHTMTRAHQLLRSSFIDLRCTSTWDRGTWRL